MGLDKIIHDSNINPRIIDYIPLIGLYLYDKRHKDNEQASDKLNLLLYSHIGIISGTTALATSIFLLYNYIK